MRDTTYKTIPSYPCCRNILDTHSQEPVQHLRGIVESTNSGNPAVVGVGLLSLVHKLQLMNQDPQPTKELALNPRSAELQNTLDEYTYLRQYLGKTYQFFLELNEPHFCWFAALGINRLMTLNCPPNMERYLSIELKSYRYHSACEIDGILGTINRLPPDYGMAVRDVLVPFSSRSRVLFINTPLLNIPTPDTTKIAGVPPRLQPRHVLRVTGKREEHTQLLGTSY